MSVYKKILFVLFVTVLTANTVFGGRYEKEYELPERYPHLQKSAESNLFGIYWRDAKPNEYLYLVPAHFGATVFILIGNVIGTPVKAVYNVFTGNFNGDAYLPPTKFCDRHLGPIGGYIIGGPFWALEKVFYELPVSLFTDDDDDEYY